MITRTTLLLTLAATGLAQVRPAHPIPDDWEEDPRRHEEGLKQCLEPDEYLLALERTGMAAHLASRGQAGPASASWYPLGPIGEFNGWNGRISDIEIRSAADEQIWVSSCQGGLWRGLLAQPGAWSSVGDNLPNPSVGGFAVDPNDADHIFVGTGDTHRYKGAGLFETTDGGDTWTLVRDDLSQPDWHHDVDYWPGSSDLILVTSSSRMLRSPDNGTSWQVLFDGKFVSDLAIANDGSHAYCCVVGEGVYRSDDLGVNWDPVGVSSLPPSSEWGRSSVAVSPIDPAWVAVLVSKGGFLQGVYVSQDAGKNWASRGQGLVNASFGTNQVGHAQAITWDPAQPARIIVGAQTTTTSEDMGNNWLTWGSPNPGHADLTRFYFSSITGHDLWITNDGGVYLAAAAGGTTSWVGTTQGLMCTEVDFMDADRDMILVGTQDNGIVESHDRGQTWQLAKSGDGGDVEIVDPVAKTFWGITGVHGQGPSWWVRRFLFGQSAEFMNNPNVYMPRVGYNRFEDKVFSHDHTRVISKLTFATPTSGWSFVTGTVPDQDPGYSIRSITVAESDGQSVYCTFWDGAAGEDNRDLTVWRKDGGTWQSTHHEDIAPADGWVHMFWPSATWPGEAWAGLAGPTGTPKLLHTTDWGQTWTDISGDPNQVNLRHVRHVSAIVTAPFDPRVIYAGTDIGMFRSTDGGTTWAPFQDGLPIGRVSDLRWVEDDAHAGDHRLIAAFDGRGVWQYDLTGPPIVYVDPTSVAAAEDGTFEYPYKTLDAAIAAAPVGATLALRAQEYTPPQAITKKLTLVGWGGKFVVR